ncbi:stealth family protein [Streptomyces xanthophaeus]|uniref:stealth family protein n=1 Tax=Streptomyces xanthophaeus TaxID=67385 RepID=UPI00364F2A91
MPPSPRRTGPPRSGQDALPYLARAYRGLVPLAARRLLFSRAPGLHRLLKAPPTWLAKAVRKLADAREHRRLRRAGLLTAPDRSVLTVQGRRTVVSVCAAPTPLSARAQTLSLVCAALAGADVDHFVVRCYGDLSSAVGVSAADRARAVAALTRLCADHAGYVSLPDRPQPRPGHRAEAWQVHAAAPVVRITRFQCDPRSALVLGAEHGCDIEFWTPADGRLLAPRPNRTTESVPQAGPAVDADAGLFTRLAPPPPVPATLAQTTPAHRTADTGRARVRTRPEFTVRLPDEVRFPVDAVYTWVDGADPAWRARRARVTDEPYHAQAGNDARYLNRDELRYSLRSLHLYAPWIRHIYLVTDRQVPAWLAPSHPGLTLVDHRDVFADSSALPTFNSHAIESRLHHIGGLSEHFLYLNDDFFLGSPLTPENFFLASGASKFFPSPALLPSGTASARDIPASAAGMNNRVLLEARFGVTVTRKMMHIPYPLRRSVLAELEREFPKEHRATAHSRLRGIHDLSIPASLYHHYAFLTGRAVPAELRYQYLDLALPQTAARLAGLLRTRNRQTFCLNDTVTATGTDPAIAPAAIRDFLEAYFPVPGPFEHTGGGERTTIPGTVPSRRECDPAPASGTVKEAV